MHRILTITACRRGRRSLPAGSGAPRPVGSRLLPASRSLRPGGHRDGQPVAGHRQSLAELKEATDLRNQGMEACLAGKTKEGRAMIEQATAMLKG